MRFFQKILRWVPVLILAIYTCGPVLARDKTDIIVLKNGNQITGEIREMSRGLLTLKTDSMETVKIKWEDIDKITSEHSFAVEVSSGWIFIGSLSPTEEPRVLNVVGPMPALNLRHLSIVEIREVQSSLWHRFSGTLEFGYTFTKASNRNQLSVSPSLGYRGERYEGDISFDAMLSTANGKDEVDRKVFSLKGRRYFTGKWLFFTEGIYEHNLELELDHRFTVRGGPGYNFYKTHRAEIVMSGGLSYTRERYFEKDYANNLLGVLAVTAQFYKLHSPKVDLVANFMFLPNITTSGRIRTEFDTKLRLEVFKDFFVTASFYDSFDSKPPSETATAHDYGFVTGVSWTFRH